jgi:hypothetical protein
MISREETLRLNHRWIRFANDKSTHNAERKDQMSTIDERDVDPISKMTRVARDFLALPSRGFVESYRSAKPAELIYDSEWCRITLVWGGWDPIGGNSIHIRYGRLHAPNEKTVMTWNNEQCRCWHRVEHALHFLDNRAPKDAAQLNYSHSLTSPFYEDEVRQKFVRRQPEWLAQMHLTIWQHYGIRLFELFDLRQPDLWQQYRQFLKEVYDIEGRIPEIKPSLDKVC